MISVKIFYIILALLVSEATAKCAFQLSRSEKVYISCTNITTAEYTNELYENLIPLLYTKYKGHVEYLFIDISDSYLPVVDKWLYVPLKDRFSRINTVRIVNSAVEKFEIKSHDRLSILKTLVLSVNNITDFTFLGRKRMLEELDVSHSTFREGNELTKYLMKSKSNLQLLKLKYCNLTRFTVIDAVKNYDLSFNPELSLLFLNQSAFETPFVNLSYNNNDNLKLISLHSKCLLSLDLSHSKKKINFNMFNNNCVIKRLTLNNNVLPPLSNLKSVIKTFDRLVKPDVHLRHTNLNDIPFGIFNSSYLNELDLSYNNLTFLRGLVFSDSWIFRLIMTNSNITSADSNVFRNLEVVTLNLSHNRISSLGGVFKFIKSVYNLDLSHNPIESLNEKDFVNCEDLVDLNLANLPLTTVHGYPFKNFLSDMSLTLTLNSSFEMEPLKSLNPIELIIINSSLDKLTPGHFKHFHSLISLTFIDSSVKTIDSQALNGLYNLVEIHNLNRKLGNYDASLFQTLYSLQFLDLSKHQIKKLNLELRDLEKLTYLNLSYNSLESLNVNSFENLKSLKTLSLGHNQISNIPVGTFRGLKKVTYLYLNNNQIQQLAPGTFSNLDSLVLLDLSENILLRTKPHLVFGFSMPQLNELYLQGNQLGNEYAQGENLAIKNEFSALANHKSLRLVDVNRNGWHCMTLADVLLSLRSKNISYRPPQIDDLLSVNIDGVSCSLV